MCANRRFWSETSGAPGRIFLFAVVVTAMSVLPGLSFADDEEVRRRWIGPGPSKPAEDPAGPRRHFRAKDPAALGDDDTARIYGELKARLAQSYRRSGDPTAMAYQDWERYNTAPYRSAAHGNRFINNYANGAAKAYGRYEEAGRMPVGAVVAKDSFTVTGDGAITAGPLFVMEKMPTGFNYVSGDWRYTMVQPDGTLFGVTKGEGSERVEFCIGCHLAVEDQDHLHFIPEEHRRR
ncbi:MAG: cytochrome P460 family protein [Hyphomicrobiales bacterium]